MLAPGAITHDSMGFAVASGMYGLCELPTLAIQPSHALPRRAEAEDWAMLHPIILTLPSSSSGDPSGPS